MDVKPHKPGSAPTAPKTAAAYKRVPPAKPQKSGWVKRVLARIPQLLPSSCALCGDAGRDTLCTPCRQRFFTRQHRRCIQCALPMPAVGKELRCGACLKNKPAFDATIVATDYFAPSDQLVLALKFSGDLRLAPLLAELIRNAALRSPLPGSDIQLPLPTMLAAVPLGRARLQERGFNQALEIAKPLSRLLDIQLHPYLLERVKETQAQSGLPLVARGRNIRKAFVVPYDAMDHVRGRHVGIVDDVMTTGETLNELAATLKRFGAKRVTNLVFARTPPG
ncbi:ComF family protein [Herbaspirillum chlorophenolicum]|uniref:ComF family protein n=1 Tax=Herbaspirillum chlorophenolicum TaxID=211589 RepID=UPI00067DBD92|nr:ComF family protein [Herbaspirillum chlorophenolicum]